MLADPVLIGTAGHILDPALIIEVPLHRLADTRLEGFSRLPAEFALDLGSVNGIATIMARTVLHIGDLLLVLLAIGSRAEFIKNCAEGVNDVQIRLLVPAANVVGFAQLARFQNAPDRRTMIFDVEPVANLLAIAVNRQRLAGKGVVDDERDELFREVVRAVVVGAVGSQNRKTVGVVVCANQMVAGRLAG